MNYVIDDTSAKVMQDDHNALAALTHPQSKGPQHGKAVPGLQVVESVIIGMVITGSLQTATNDFTWDTATYDPSTQTWTACGGGQNSTELGNAVYANNATLLLRNSDGQNVLISGTPVGTLQYQNYCMTTQNQAGFDWARAHC